MTSSRQVSGRGHGYGSTRLVHVPIAELMDEHFELRVKRLPDNLFEQIDKENLGTFPVAVVTLGAAGWEIVTAAHS